MNDSGTPSQPITFAGRRKFMLGLLILCLILGGGSLDAALDGHTRFWFAFVACALMSAVLAVPVWKRDSLYLHLDKDGLDICSMLGRHTRIRWTEIAVLQLRETGTEGKDAIEIEYTTPAGPRLSILHSWYGEPLAVIHSALDKWRETYGRRPA